MSMGPFSFRWSLSTDTRLLCARCGGELGDKPVTGRCGHSLCDPCHTAVALDPKRNRQWQPCPMIACGSSESFEVAMKPSSTILIATKLIRELDHQTSVYVDRIRKEMGHYDATSTKQSLAWKTKQVEEKDRQIACLEKQLAESKDEILCMENRNYGMVRFSNSLMKRLDETPGGCHGADQPDVPSTVAVVRRQSDSDSSEYESSIGMTQKLDECVAEFERREMAKTSPASPCDTSSGSFQPVLKRRKVSLENPTTGGGRARLKGDFSDGSESTSEAEFLG